MEILDPLKLCKFLWPHVFFYKEQREVIYSVRDNPETFCPAGNKLGKDFVSAFIALWFFLSRRPARVVTTSVKQDQLEDVLWGEIKRFLNNTKHQLPIHRKHLDLRQVRNSAIGKKNPDPHEFIDLTELVGEVSKSGEGLLGRHAPYGPNGEPTTLVIFDESSGIGDTAFESVSTWAHRKLAIGNCFDCVNFFYRGVKAGNEPDPLDPSAFFRKVIKIRAQDSPNVLLAEKQIREGKEPTNEIIVPGTKTYKEYLTHRKVWDKKLQCIGLDAEFYEGEEVRLFPLDWIADAETPVRRQKTEGKVCIGVDPAEGGDLSVWTVADNSGILEQLAKKTPDTSKIPGETLALMQKWGVPAREVYFDRGGGGKQIADQLRALGYPVNTVGFGESLAVTKKIGRSLLSERRDIEEEKYSFKNRRSQMYWMLREAIDPNFGGGFKLPSHIINAVNGDGRKSLKDQLIPIPLERNNEGTLVLPPKNKPPATRRGINSQKELITLVSIIGHSPDEADSLVLAIYGLKKKSTQMKIGAF